jgi:protein SMG7
VLPDDSCNSIRKQYRKLILDFPEFCQENNGKRDVMGQLWKGFHRQIEDFRKTIRRFKEHSEAQLSVMQQDQLKKLSRTLQCEFQAFLVYGIQFFQKLMTEVCRVCRLTVACERHLLLLLLTGLTYMQLEKKAVSLPAQQTLSNEHFTFCVHRCLLFLGDLSRYQELFGDREQKNFIESIRYYERAALIVPSAGLPQNQVRLLSVGLRFGVCVTAVCEYSWPC